MAAENTSTTQNINNQSKNRTLLNVLILLLVSLISAFIGAFGYYYYSTNYVDSVKCDCEEEDSAEDNGEASKTSKFSGEFLTAELPKDWSIKEYIDGENDDYLAKLDIGDEFSGLTGFAVLDEDSKEVFRVDGGYGIGGQDICVKYPKFSDSDPTHMLQKQGETEQTDAKMEVIDLTTAQFEEYEILDVRVRRIESALYWDEEEKGTFFEPGCGGLIAQTLPYSGLSFTTPEATVSTYLTKLPISTEDEAKLELLDKVLQSLEAK